jgi:hypothetical protein
MKFTDVIKEDAVVDALKKQGKSKGDLNSDFNPIELEIGIMVEKEHVDSDEAAAEISKDHLAENPFYYTKVLAKAEPEVMDKAMKVLKKHGFNSLAEYFKSKDAKDE